jgi:hypothetical protein
MTIRLVTAVCLPALLLSLGSCAVRASRPAAALQLRRNDENLYVTPISEQHQPVADSESFPELMTRRYAYNQREGYVNLLPGMRLHILRVAGRTTTDSAWFHVSKSIDGRLRLTRVPEKSGQRLDAPGPASQTISRRINARYLRFFFETRFAFPAGQPARNAVLLWAGNAVQLEASTAWLRDNAAFSCAASAPCIDFPGVVTVSPEILVSANASPVYTFLGTTVGELLRTAHAPANPPALKVYQEYGGHLIPITWAAAEDVMKMPVLAGDRISW